jgi:beta-glucanase (GH16 family)
LLGLLSLIFVLPGHANSVAEMTRDGWSLTFDDEFNGTSLDSTKWNVVNGNQAIINHELQAYLADNVVLSGDGMLDLVARHEPGLQQGVTQQYTSGEITTHKKFSQAYGYFEIRCQMPPGKGMWPAFWLLRESGGWPPEIDIFENLGREPNKLYFTNHYVVNKKHESNGLGVVGDDYTSGFHTIAVDWEPGLIVWYVDDKEQFRSAKGVPTDPFYIILNLALGGNWAKPPDAGTPFPGKLEVDYVRVYQKSSASASLHP